MPNRLVQATYPLGPTPQAIDLRYNAGGLGSLEDLET